MPISLNNPGRVPLRIAQGTRYTKVLAWRRDDARVELDDYEVRAEIRTIPRGRLIADISPYFTIDAELDEIVLDIPPSATWQIDRSGGWDMFLIHKEDPDDAVMFAKGPVAVTRATTKVR